MNNVFKGAIIASAVAGLLATTACGTPTTTTQQVKCSGINDCKGQGACGAADKSHDCAGKNECKGKGWVKKSEADCKTAGGTNLGPA